MNKSDLGYIVRDTYTPNGTYAKDHRVWLKLLSNAYKEDINLYYKLSYLRGVGTIITINQNNGLRRLEPIIGTQGWIDMAEWEREKRCLISHVETLKKLLAEL